MAWLGADMVRVLALRFAIGPWKGSVFLEHAPTVPRRNVSEFVVGCASPRHECSEVAAGRGER